MASGSVRPQSQIPKALPPERFSWKNVRLGFNGYWLQQLTHHQINGSDVSNSKERTVGLGPGVQLGSGTI
jgi:hypothetical protein